MFHIAQTKDILEGKITDVYFERAMKILEKKGINPFVRAEVIAKGLPRSWPWALFAGLEEVLFLMEQLPVFASMLSARSVHPVHFFHIFTSSRSCS